MLNRAYCPEGADGELNARGRSDERPPRNDRHDLERAAVALVQLEAWTRQRGLGGLAALIDEAANHADQMLTGPAPR